MLEDAAARRTWDPFWGNAALRHIVLCGEPLTAAHIEKFARCGRGLNSSAFQLNLIRFFQWYYPTYSTQTCTRCIEMCASVSRWPLVHFSSQPEPLSSLKPPNAPHKKTQKCLR